MTRRRVFYIAIAFLVLASGCGPCHNFLFCDPSHCAAPIGPACGPCEPECGPECRPPVAGVRPWGGPVCGPRHPSYGRGLLGWLFALFRPHGAWCDGGCGERYWGGFLSDPPDCCDPCDRCGNWVGGVGAVGVGPLAGAGSVGPVVPAGAVAAPEACPDCLLPPARAVSRLGPGRGFTAAPAGPTVLQPGQPWRADAEPGIVTDTTSPYAPRLLSVTDRVVAPASPERAQQAPPEPAEAPEARVAESPQPAEGALR